MANPILNSAASLLNVLRQLQQAPTQGDTNQFRDNLRQEITKFEQLAEQRGLDRETLVNARYVLCASIDEVVLTKGAKNLKQAWSNRSLLNMFYQDTCGGKKIFSLLDQLLEFPAKNIDILELLAVCLALGFTGSYKVIENGSQKLRDLREHLAEVIGQQRGLKKFTMLVTHDSAKCKRKKAYHYWSLLVTGILLGAIVVGVNAKLTASMQPIYQTLHQIETGQNS